MACGTHGSNKVVVLDPLNPPPFLIATPGEVLAERDRCRRIAADHVWKCQGKICDCARKIAYDIMDIANNP